jgi:hypothetical protein
VLANLATARIPTRAADPHRRLLVATDWLETAPVREGVVQGQDRDAAGGIAHGSIAQLPAGPAHRASSAVEGRCCCRKAAALLRPQPAASARLRAVQADGTAPWCVGIESAGATGWVGTDWIEDFVLRYGGPEKYDQWVKHEIPFTDPVVVQAGQEFEKLALADGQVFGGRKGVVSTNFATAMNPQFDDPPKCFLHRQGNFITQKGFLTEKARTNLDENVGVFQLPSVNAADKPMLGGGDLAGAFTNDEDVKRPWSSSPAPRSSSQIPRPSPTSRRTRISTPPTTRSR